MSLLAKRGEASKSVKRIKRRARRGELSFWRSQNQVFSISKLEPIDPGCSGTSIGERMTRIWADWNGFPAFGVMAQSPKETLLCSINFEASTLRV
jgi:hypothetical protein